ncbi:unnamed protein product, partial [Didymodactylos carnosus]
STIRNADKIVVIQKGVVVEEGDHETLMNKRGNYYALIEAQNLRRAEEENESEYDEEEDEDNLHVRRERTSTVISLTPSVFTAIRGTQENDNNDKRKDSSEKKPSPVWTMLKMNSPEWLYIVFGCLASLCNGGIQPVYGYLFACSGEILTKRLRAKVFQTMLKQDVTFYDDPTNSTGALCTRLAVETSAVKGATGIRLGLMLQNLASLGVGIILAFIFGWALTLMLLGFTPLLVISGFLQTKLMSGFATNDKRTLEKAGKITVEAIQNIRTVAQLTKEKHFGDEYTRLLDIPYKSPDYNKAVEAAKNILDLFARKPAIDNSSSDGEQIANFSGELEFEGMYFVYPTRPDAIVLRNFKLKVKAG